MNTPKRRRSDVPDSDFLDANALLRTVIEESTDSATGETLHYQSIKIPLTTPQGDKQILVIANDVSELKRVQLKLEESERRLRYVLDATDEGIWDWDIPSGVVTHKLPDNRALPTRELPAQPVFLWADQKKAQMALLNVLSNAYKYSAPDKPVHIAVQTQPGEVILCVTDQGVGMRPDQTARVGERFYRADSSGKVSGSGLGMRPAAPN